MRNPSITFQFRDAYLSAMPLFVEGRDLVVARNEDYSIFWAPRPEQVERYHLIRHHGYCVDYKQLPTTIDQRQVDADDSLYVKFSHMAENYPEMLKFSFFSEGYGCFSGTQAYQRCDDIGLNMADVYLADMETNDISNSIPLLIRDNKCGVVFGAARLTFKENSQDYGLLKTALEHGIEFDLEQAKRQNGFNNNSFVFEMSKICLSKSFLKQMGGVKPSQITQIAAQVPFVLAYSGILPENSIFLGLQDERQDIKIQGYGIQSFLRSEAFTHFGVERRLSAYSTAMNLQEMQNAKSQMYSDILLSSLDFLDCDDDDFYLLKKKVYECLGNLNGYSKDSVFPINLT